MPFVSGFLAALVIAAAVAWMETFRASGIATAQLVALSPTEFP
jgi:hypothetical protein